MESSPPPRMGRVIGTWARTYRYPISITVFAIGILLCIFAAADFIPPLGGLFGPVNALTDPSRSNPSAPNYDLAFAILGPIIFIVGAYLTGAYVIARRRFEHLMETRSKAEFLRNIPEIEQILWDLTPRDEERYFARRAELKIRR